ncbi:MAG TPA: hypothetical protein VGO75_08290, partial [Gemmatimonadaceae bacterium]|nr:hypothetical protein [Gemmatimonadaceae bacterium]
MAFARVAAAGRPIFVAMQPARDMSATEFRKYGHDVIDWIADYLERPETWPVLPKVVPGDIR